MYGAIDNYILSCNADMFGDSQGCLYTIIADQ
jgi:hypothetical protein